MCLGVSFARARDQTKRATTHSAANKHNTQMCANLRHQQQQQQQRTRLCRFEQRRSTLVKTVVLELARHQRVQLRLG
jgi:hypothetical protein